MIYVGQYLVFGLLGALLNAGGFEVSSWRWWAWMLSMSASIYLRQWCLS